ncbi:MAG: NAD(P)H-hydrate dehydratase, partial [Chloroflexi bacterium]|nr:NAD(P)H-hydrate dehydratase [Chloroflexota bacterium]
AHKGSFGKVLVVAGSINYIGAAALASSAAARVGGGLVTLATARSLVPVIASRTAEATYLPLPEVDSGVIDAAASQEVLSRFADYEVLLMGCGLGQHPSTVEFVTRTLEALPDNPAKGVVLDADTLNALARTPRWWTRVRPRAVLTPHAGEMARLCGKTPTDVQAMRLQVARDAASQWKKTVVLKGAHTVIADPQGATLVSPFANPALASAGTGDVLTGAIAGMLAQGLAPLDAAACGVYLHALAGELVRAELGDAGLLAGDLLPALPRAIKRLKEGHGPRRRAEWPMPR